MLGKWLDFGFGDINLGTKSVSAGSSGRCVIFTQSLILER